MSSFEIALFVIVMSIVFLGGVIGGQMCAIVEQNILGKPDTNNEYKLQRLTSHLNALLVGILASYMLADWYDAMEPTINWPSIGISVFLGLIVYYVVHRTIYSILLKMQSRKH